MISPTSLKWFGLLSSGTAWFTMTLHRTTGRSENIGNSDISGKHNCLSPKEGERSHINKRGNVPAVTSG